MRFGLLEIVLVAVVILIIFGLTRAKQVGERLGGKSGSSGSSEPAKKSVPVRSPRLQAFGFVIVVGGIVLLALSFGLIKAIAGYAVWGAVVTAIGVTISRPRVNLTGKN